jgi:hypothetical protein
LAMHCLYFRRRIAPPNAQTLNTAACLAAGDAAPLTEYADSTFKEREVR